MVESSGPMPDVTAPDTEPSHGSEGLVGSSSATQMHMANSPRKLDSFDSSTLEVPAAQTSPRKVASSPNQSQDDFGVQRPLDVFPDVGRPKVLRRFQLAACAQLDNITHLQEALKVPRRRLQNCAGAEREVTLTPLEAASQAGKVENVRLLLQYVLEREGRPEDVGVSRIDTAVALATDSGAADVVRLLLQARACANRAAGTSRRPPLLAAVRDGQPEMVSAFCEHPDVDVDIQDERGATALHEAVYRQSKETIGTLLARRANPAIADNRSWTPLHLAAHLANKGIMEQLLEAGASINGEAKVREGGPSENNDSQVQVQPPPEQGAAAHTTTAPSAATADASTAKDKKLASGWAPLHYLLIRGDAEGVQHLIARGANACMPGGPDGMNPLMLAISYNFQMIAMHLLGLEAVYERIDEQDRRGRCALHFALMASPPSLSIVQALLESHASPNIRNENGLTAVDVARSGNTRSSDVVKRLQEEEIVRLVMLRSRCRAQKKYEEAELIRGDLRHRGVNLDIQNERWMMPDGTWGYLAADRSRAQPQGGPGFDRSNVRLRDNPSDGAFA